MIVIDNYNASSVAASRPSFARSLHAMRSAFPTSPPSAVAGRSLRPGRRATLMFLLALLPVLLPVLSIMTTAMAQQRNPLQTIGETVAERDSAHYRFERFRVSSADGTRTWRIHLGIPRSEPPANGWPAFWMLDGNAALIEFDDALLADLAARPLPQVLVFVGYDNALRIDSAQRSRDYTPQLTPQAQRAEAAHPLTGGADAFLELIERDIRMQIARRVRTDPARQTLWGHSLGGLFALHGLFTRPGAFHTYVAGSPSMWWQDGYMVAQAERFASHNAGRPARVLIHLGAAERAGDRGRRDLADPRVVAHLARLQSVPPDAAMRLAQRLAKLPGIEAGYREFGGLGHGPMFRASLMAALHAVAGVADRSATPRPAAAGDASP